MSTKKDQLKTLFKPIIKECVKELILEQGILSSLISEINKANGGTHSVNSDIVAKEKNELQRVATNKVKIDEAKRKIYAAVGADTYSSIFENVEPLTSYEAGGSSTSPANPLGDQAPNDPGVDITSIPGMSMWKTLATDKKR